MRVITTKGNLEVVDLFPRQHKSCHSGNFGATSTVNREWERACFIVTHTKEFEKTFGMYTVATTELNKILAYSL